MARDRSLQHLCNSAPKDCHASRAFLYRLRLYTKEAQGVVLDGWKGYVEFCSLLCLPSLLYELMAAPYDQSLYLSVKKY